MKNWYKSTPTKGVLLILEHFLAVVIAVCMMFILMYPGQEYGDSMKDLSKKEYADTKGFETSMLTASHEILNQIENEQKFETKGKYDPEKIVDIEQYLETGEVTGENISGLAYRLGDLEKWAQYYDENEIQNIVVCQKEDSTYDYYLYDDFIAKVRSGEFRISRNNNKEFLEELKNGYVTATDYEDMEVQNAAFEKLYHDFWNFNEGIEEKALTVDGKSLLQIAGETTEWNGKLHKLYGTMSTVLHSIDSELASYREGKRKWEEDNTNLTYFFEDLNDNKVYCNREKYANAIYIPQLEHMGKFVKATPLLSDFKTNLETEADLWCSNTKLGTDNYIFIVAVDTEYPIQDQFYKQNKLFNTYAPYINKMVILITVSLIGFLIIFVWLTTIAGRTVGDDKVTLMWFDKIKTELGAAVILIIWTGAVAVIGMGIDGRAFRDVPSNILLLALIAFVSCAGFFIGYLSLVRRIKAGTLWKNSVIRWFLSSGKKFLQYRSCTFKVTTGVLAFIIVHWIAIGTNGQDGWMFLTFVVEGYVLYYMLSKAITRQKIKKGIQEISSGNVNYQIPLAGLKGDQRDIAVYINNIGEGLNKAVEQSMKDERLKTDLITNVSHDIKTPLTSIINYVDLLKRENIQDPKIQGYIEILEAKAQRLKQLTEDVVEASKISSGNITMEYMNINFVEMIQQTNGEFAEKFAKRTLHPVLNLPDHPVVIRSDGRRMWRVIENIYNNAAKYAMEGTRVYADMIEKEHTVEFSLKNISEQPLNISADELTERFIRGDVSRSTEGSGLGLSIAKNLTQMQGGEFNLYLDGDLFKVTIVFPKIIINEK